MITVKSLFKNLEDPLYKNSFFLTLARFINVAMGFVFWIIAAKFYSVEDVGVATALLSSLGILILFSRLGFDSSLIRFVHINDKNKVFNTSIIITTIFSLIAGIIYILGIDFISPGLSFLKNPGYAIIFLFFVIMNSIISITGIAFIAIRKADYYFVQNTILGLRILLLTPLIFLGSLGIFGSVGLAYFFSALFSFYYLKKFIKFEFAIDNQFINESFRFSSGNYISNIMQTSNLFLPILVFNLLGGAETAKYYIAFAIGNLVLIIPDALSTSLFVEGSHGESLKKNVIKAGLVMSFLLIPAVIFIYFFGDILLGLIGKNYVDSFELLKLLVLSSFFVAAYSLFISIQNVRMNVGLIVKLNLLMFVLLMGLSYVLILKFGIVGVGYAWTITYGILALVVGVLIKRAEWI